MKVFKILLPILMIGSILNAESNRPFINHTCDLEQNTRYDTELSERDWEELYDFINTKRTINLAEKSQNLTLAGDVRVLWRNIRERAVRGGHKVDADGNRLGPNDFDVRLNLYFDYVCDRSWAVAQLEFDNSMGVGFNDNEIMDPEGLHGSGFGCDLAMKKAYIGYNVFCGGDARFDIEIGRRHFYHVFDSEIEFLSRFDGVLLRYVGAMDCLDYHVYLGGFVIDERCNHFGWITELGLFNINETGVDFLYSFIDWRKKGLNRFFVRNPEGSKFMVSQWLLKYHIDPSYVCGQPSHFYGAFLWNHCVADVAYGRKRNMGWYVGYRIGQIVETGDWGFDLQYQYVGEFAIPNRDVAGIGRGNFNDDAPSMNGRGNTNYKGWRFEFIYAVTDDLILDASVEASRVIHRETQINRTRFSQVEVEFIYAF